jgi:hypothetical protein
VNTGQRIWSILRVVNQQFSTVADGTVYIGSETRCSTHWTLPQVRSL